MKKCIPILLVLLLLLTIQNSIAQALSNENFVYSAAPLKPVQAANYNTLTPSELKQSVTYFDGLGRPIQSNGMGQGGNAFVIVTHMEYDGFGRQVKDYLPYAIPNTGSGYLKADALTATNNYYIAHFPSEINAITPNPFSEKSFEASPLNRVLQQAAPGNDRALVNNHTIKLDCQTNIG